jgi:2-polyprenyl-6-methoxyphenol hydroxylase-like FAD-dependent oxidoreductase
MIKILIVGAGICGLALARRLTNTNVKVTLIERDSHFPPGGAGICLPANAVLQMKRLGLYDRLIQAAHEVNLIEYAKSSGETLTCASLGEPPLNKAAFVALPRQRLMDLLQYGMSNAVCFSSQVTKITDTEGGLWVHVNHSTRPEFFDLVVAADGIHSTTRQLVFKDAKAQSLGVTHWRFLVDHPERETHPTYYLGDDHAFMIYPTGAQQSYCYAQVSDPTQSYRQAPPLESLQQLFGQYCEPVAAMLRALTPSTRVYTGTLESVKLDSCYQGRTVLVGDALHGCPPSLQQGVGMGLEDINSLADLITRHPVDDALQLYNEERLARVRWVVEESNRLIELAKRGNTWYGRLIRNTLLRQKGPANVAAWRRLLADTPLQSEE